MWESKWLCILTSGHTVDGREVSPEVVDQIAETYNPDTYNARINIEHNSYGSKLGSVVAVKSEAEGDTRKLFAKLKPNDYLLYLLGQGQKLHTSCEIAMNFAKTGKAYLTGLAVTDSPASLGTTEMHLSADGEQAQIFSTSEEIKGVKPSLFSNPFSKKEETSMNNAAMELLAQIQESQKQTATVLAGISDQMQSLSTQTTPPADPAPNKDPEPENDPETVALSALGDEVKKLAENQQATQKQLEELVTKLASQTDEPHRHEATGGHDDDDDNPVL